jgi:hypothetical protein
MTGMRRYFIILALIVMVSGIGGQSIKPEFKSQGWSGNPVFHIVRVLR